MLYEYAARALYLQCTFHIAAVKTRLLLVQAMMLDSNEKVANDDHGSLSKDTGVFLDA